MLKAILKATLLAGSLDISAAFIQVYLRNKTMPSAVLKYIASAVFGKAAFAAGYGMMAWGLLFHFIIAFACAAVFFLLYSKLNFLKYSYMLNALLIALVAWTITNLVILPLSNVPKGSFNLTRAAIAATILFVCIGLPISIGAKRYFSARAV
jgi:hypothetical protein